MSKSKLEYEVIYTFPSVPGLVALLDGSFEYNNRPVRKIYNNGSLSVLCGQKKKGIIKLRKEAVKSTREIINIPF
jgi:hypothetical protein